MAMKALLAQYAAILALCIFAVAFLADVATMRISNRLTGALALLYVVATPFSAYRWDQALATAGVSFAVLAAGLLLFARGWVGGGDVKLAAGAVLWVGAEQALAYFVYTSLAGGALTLALILFRKLPLGPAMTRTPWIARLHTPNGKVPYGVALASAAIFLLPGTPWFLPPG